eukprot:8866346-Alexandrium_andersonii.AAC.1
MTPSSRAVLVCAASAGGPSGLVGRPPGVCARRLSAAPQSAIGGGELPVGRQRWRGRSSASG